jgi:predicted RNA-binding protein YlqC (UPF0109 family)
MNDSNEASTVTPADDMLGTLLIDLVRKLVNRPESVSLHVIPLETGVMYRIAVAPTDLGKVIGRQGRLARSFRILLGAIAAKRKESIKLDFVESCGDDTL